MPPLTELFETVGQRMEGAVGALFGGAAVKMAAVAGRPPQTALKMQLEEMPGVFTAGERSLLLELCGCLGRYDLRGQARALEVFRSRLHTEIVKGEAESQTKSRAWLTASVCGGLAVVVMAL